MILVPPSHPKTTVTLKAWNESMDRNKFVEVITERIKHKIRLEENEIKTRFTFFKLENDQTMTVMSPALHRKIAFRQAGLYAKQQAKYVGQDFKKNNFKPAWEVYHYRIHEIQDTTAMMRFPIPLESRSFHQRQDAVAHLNSLLKSHNISFTLKKNNVLQLAIAGDKTRVTFSNSLRDILALDNNTYSGKGRCSGSGSFSLVRWIHYLYVYSSVSDYVRIGDTEVPLLTVIPFNPEVCVNLLQETTFKLPMYAPVNQNLISQIYDGAGESLASDAVTSLRLHFRRL